jgi:hypothetical protein
VILELFCYFLPGTFGGVFGAFGGHGGEGKKGWNDVGVLKQEMVGKKRQIELKYTGSLG